MVCEYCEHYKKHPNKCRTCDDGPASYLNYKPKKEFRKKKVIEA